MSIIFYDVSIYKRFNKALCLQIYIIFDKNMHDYQNNYYFNILINAFDIVKYLQNTQFC